MEATLVDRLAQPGAEYEQATMEELAVGQAEFVCYVGVIPLCLVAPKPVHTSVRQEPHIGTPNCSALEHEQKTLD